MKKVLSEAFFDRAPKWGSLTCSFVSFNLQSREVHEVSLDDRFWPTSFRRRPSDSSPLEVDFGGFWPFSCVSIGAVLARKVSGRPRCFGDFGGFPSKSRLPDVRLHGRRRKRVGQAHGENGHLRSSKWYLVFYRDWDFRQ